MSYHDALVRVWRLARAHGISAVIAAVRRVQPHVAAPITPSRVGVLESGSHVVSLYTSARSSVSISSLVVSDTPPLVEMKLNQHCGS